MVQTWPAARNPCTTQFDDESSASIAGGTSTCETSKRKILDVVVIGLPRGHGIGWGRGFKSHGKEHNLPLRIRAGKFQRIERRIHDAHIGAFGLGVEQALRRSGHAQHVAERTENHFRAVRNGHRFVDQFNRRHAHRATRPVDQRNVAGQQVFEAALDDGVSLPAADFHDRPGAG